MRRIRRDEGAFNLSAVDLFCSALGAVLILTVILFPFYGKEVRVRNLEMVFVVDTTGSMENQIEDLQRNLDSIVVSLLRLCGTLRIGVVAYKDDSPHSEYSTKAFPLSPIQREDADGGASMGRLQAFLNELRADGGDSNPHEDLHLALEEAMAMGWSGLGDEALIQTLVVVGDVGPYPEREEAVLQMIRQWTSRGADRRFMAVFTHQDPGRRAAFYPSFERMADAAGSGGMAHLNTGNLLGSILDAVLMR